MGGICRNIMRLVIALCMMAGAVATVGTSYAQDTNTPSEDFEWFTWHGLFNECDGHCGVAFHFGARVDTFGPDLVGDFDTVPLLDWDWGDGYLLALSASRRAATIAGVLDLEPEIGVAKRIVDSNEFEFWSALWLRWTWFPWDKYLITTFGFSTGLSYATDVSAQEKFISGNGEGSKLLHYLSSEATLALPDHPDWELAFRFHHRSGAYRYKSLRSVSRAIWNSTFSGVHYMTVGVRKRF